MTNTIWTKWLLQLRAHSQRRRAQNRTARTAARSRLAVENLEARDVPAVITVVPATGALSLTNNDFTVLQSAIGSAATGDTIDIQGTFNWNGTFASAAYVASTSTSSTADIRGIRLPDGVSNLTITSSTNDAHILGLGDLSDGSFDAFLFANDSATATGDTNLVVEKLNIDDFEAGVVFGWNGTGTFNGTTVRNNTITLGGDNEGTQNIALYFTIGSNQQVTGNTFNFQGDGTRTTGTGARSFAFQNSTTGGTGYDGLLIANNVFQLAASSTGSEIDNGIWENGHNDDNNSHISITNNQFKGRQGIDAFDRALLLSSQTTGLVLDGNQFTDVDNVFYASSSQGHTAGDQFTFTNSILTRVGGSDGIFIQNVTNDVTPIHVVINWNINNTVDGFTGVRGLNELSTQATPTGAATDLSAVNAVGTVTAAVVVPTSGTGRFTDPDGIGTGVGPVAVGFNDFATIQAGINATASGGSVQIAAGTYAGGADATAAGKGITLSAGSGTGLVTVDGLTLDSNDTLSVNINSSTAGTGYDQLVVNGTVALGGAALAVTGTRSANAGDVLVLVKNDGIDPVSGTFQGLAEGSTVVVNGVSYVISYTYNAEAGTTVNGNDVALVDVSPLVVSTPPSTTPSVGATPAGAVSRRFAIGSASGGVINVYDNGAPLVTNASVYPGFTGGVAVAVGDVTGDGVPDIATVIASGGPAWVKVFDGATGAERLSFLAIGAGYQGGASIALGDTDGDGKAEIIIGLSTVAAVGIFDGTTGALRLGFLAYPEAPMGSVGVRVAAGDLDGDGKAEIITTPTGIAPLVRAFDANGNMVRSFFAFDPAIASVGLTVGTGDLNGDGQAEIIVGASAFGVDYVLAFNGDTSRQAAFALPAAPTPTTIGRVGPQVGAADINGDGAEDILVTVGSVLSAFNGRSLSLIGSIVPYPDLDGGVYVG